MKLPSKLQKNLRFSEDIFNIIFKEDSFFIYQRGCNKKHLFATILHKINTYIKTPLLLKCAINVTISISSHFQQ